MKIVCPSGFALFLTEEEASHVKIHENAIIILTPSGRKKVLEIPESWIMGKSCVNDFKKSSNSDASRSLYLDSTADTAHSVSASAVVSQFQIQSDIKRIQEPFKNYSRTNQRPLKDHSRINQGPLEDHSRITQEPLKDHSRSNQGLPKNHSRTDQGPLKDHSRINQGPLEEYSRTDEKLSDLVSSFLELESDDEEGLRARGMELKEFCNAILLKVGNIRLSSEDETAEFAHKYNKLLQILSSDIEKMQRDLEDSQPGEKPKSKIPKKKKKAKN